MSDRTHTRITCIEFRNLVGGDPARRDAALAEHRLGCRGCADYARAVEQLDRSIFAALAVPVPEGLGHRVVLRATAEDAPQRMRFAWASAAVAAAVALIAVALLWAAPWRGVAQESLAREVMAHAHHETISWDPNLVPVASTRLRGVLARGEVALLDEAQLGIVVYARTCVLRGHKVPHLTVQGTAGPAMVLLLADEPIAHEEKLDEDGLRGVLVPVGTGSIAIVAADPAAVEAVRQRVVSALALGI